MKKGILRKAVSAVLALAFVIALMPTMFASAAEVGDTITFEFLPDPIKEGENLGTLSSVEDLSDYFAQSEENTYSRDWKFFSKKISNTSATNGITQNHGMYYDDGGIKYAGDWIALKVKGIPEGVYNIRMTNNPSIKKGCIWGLYILDSSTQTSKIDDMLISENKVGEVDLYGSVRSELEFGTTSLNGNTGEYIVVLRAERGGYLNADETCPTNSSGKTLSTAAYLSIKSLIFTKTTEARESEVFGDHAAFIEHTDTDEANLYLISAIESLNYSKVGFKLKVGNSDIELVPTTKVYTGISIPAKQLLSSGGNQEETTLSYTAADFGLSGKYLYVVKKTLTEGFTGQTINFKPYAVSVDGETTIEGSTYQATLKSN